ncbi:D-sedoheptulose-7-phosphate isomerase [Rhodospirillum centenum]|uniref:Phosphoheptose isomerase n=1 Tax=Rhodospirillum centenum (strain ATCC 51521 / SW) TaxID=414684 RepID=B6IS24_RHOCS|nr:D-sedoheptulose 7-phosphate isomerase [Rhodospirillum centenum]ACI98260.1 phosphoheptose isomerase [Rhodospirillum centenum SW]
MTEAGSGAGPTGDAGSHRAGAAPRVRAALEETAANFRTLAAQAEEIARAAAVMADSIRAGGKVMFCGNGGSAADSQHIAAELSGRFLAERRALPGLALTVDTSALTAIGNDYGFERIFARQVEALGRPGDVLVAFSTSGNSPNVLAAVATARHLGIVSIGMTGARGGALRAACDLCLCVPSEATPRIQEMHIAIGHALCDLLDGELSGGDF